MSGKDSVKEKKEKKNSKPKKHELYVGSLSYLEGGNLKEAVKLPPREDPNEWLAVNTVDFVNQLNLLLTVLPQYCTADACPIMTAGPKYEYKYSDDQIKKPVSVPAPQYLDMTINWMQQQLDDDELFPSIQWKANFFEVLQQMYKKMFRVYAHIYTTHFHQFYVMGLEAHLNTSFFHLYYFIVEHNLIESKEFRPLKKLIEAMEKPEKSLNQ